MNGLHYTVANKIFSKFSAYSRGVVLSYDVTNGLSPDELILLLRDAEASVRERLDINTLTQHPQIKSWRDAYRSFGAKPNKFRSSIEGLARRALRRQELPSINALVDISTIISLKHLVPTGV